MQADLARRLQDRRPGNLQRLLDLAGRDRDPDDTHPTLPQRVAAMGVDPALPAPPTMTSAVELLGPRVAFIERQLDAQWRTDIGPCWRERYAAAATDRARLSTLEARATHTPSETLEYARLVESLRVDFDAVPLYERALAVLPDSALAHYRCGLLRVRRGDGEAGLAQLQRAMTLDPGAIRPVLADLEQFARDPDLDAATADALAGLRATFAPRARELDARDAVVEQDEFQPHDLDEPGLGKLGRALAGLPRVGRAWLVRKRLGFAEDAAHYVVLVEWRGSVASEAAGLQHLAATFDLPGSFSVFTGTDHRDTASRVRRTCGEPVYRKSA